MKKQLLTALVVAASLCGYAQTKGTSALGFGINAQTHKSKYYVSGADQNTNEIKYNAYSLSYGLFIKDNTKLGVEFNYGTQDDNYVSNVSGNKTKFYGGGVNYQYYYPLVQRLYAYAGGKLNYNYSKSENAVDNTIARKTNEYVAGVYGGVTWFVSKRFALETSLLSANAIYVKTKIESAPTSYSSTYQTTSTAFNLSSTGSLSNLGFKIYVLF
jgi:hypothetical protein